MSEDIDALYAENVDPIRGPYTVIDPTKEYFDPKEWRTKDRPRFKKPSQYVAYETDIEEGELHDVM